MKEKMPLAKLVFLGMLVAITLVLQQFSVGPTTVKVGLAFIGNLLLAYYYGPIWGGIGAGLADLLRSALFGDEGGFFIGFTISAILAVVIYGIFLYQKDFSWWRLAISTWLVTFIVNLILNTYWLHLIYGLDLMAAFWQRLPKELITPWVQIIIGGLVLKAFSRVKIDWNWIK